MSLFNCLQNLNIPIDIFYWKNKYHQNEYLFSIHGCTYILNFTKQNDRDKLYYAKIKINNCVTTILNETLNFRQNNKKMRTCANKNCQLSVYRDNECILHCKKNQYNEDHHTSQILPKFFDELKNYIIHQIITHNNNLVASLSVKEEREQLEDYFNNTKISNKQIISKTSRDIIFNDIFFPNRDPSDEFDYFNLLGKIDSAYFNKCKFLIKFIDLANLKMFFKECDFENYWAINDQLMLENDPNTIYLNCKFKKTVTLSMKDADGDFSIFRDCNFLSELNIDKSKIKVMIFNNSNKANESYKKIKIINSSIEHKFILNKTKIEEFFCENSSFKLKFEFKENKAKFFTIFNTNFHEIFDSYKTEFAHYKSEKCIFFDFTGYEQCKFGETEIALFKYITYLNIVNFREAKFFAGLDLENTNLKEPPNFLKVSIEPQNKIKNTNRETFRIIKNSFEKSGNRIEANKYFALEMKQYKLELSDKPFFSQEKMILRLNEKISNFGMSYFRSLSWILIFSIIYKFLIYGYENNFLYKIYPPYNYYILKISCFFNDFAKNIIPFEKFLKNDMEFLSLLFYIILASLIWQTIVSIKRHTRNN